MYRKYINTGVVKGFQNGCARTPLLAIRNPTTNVFNDPLKWWKFHESKFPLLAKLARIYLAV
jgi:hypothetical protein